MEEKINENLVVSLIKDDLIHSKLLNVFTSIDVDISNYNLYLGDTIFKLMGFGEDHYSDRVFEVYVELRKKVKNIKVSQSSPALDTLALEIFQMLKGTRDTIDNPS